MRKEVLKHKLTKLLEDSKPELDRMIEKAINSQAIDIEASEDNMLLPKIILCAVYSEMAWQYEPITKAGKKEVKNLKIFL